MDPRGRREDLACRNMACGDQTPSSMLFERCRLSCFPCQGESNTLKNVTMTVMMMMIMMMIVTIVRNIVPIRRFQSSAVIGQCTLLFPGFLLFIS